MAASINIISSVGFIICCLLLIVSEIAFGVSLTHKFLQKQNLNALGTGQKVLRGSTVSIFFSVGLFTLLIFIRGTVDLSTNSVDYRLNETTLTFKFVQYALMAVTYVSFHCYMLSKLYVSFADSAYSIKSYVIHIHIAFIILVIVAATIMVIVVVSDTIDALIGNILFVIIVSFVVLPFLHLLFAFNRRLFNLCQLQQQTMYSLDQTFELSKSQQKLLSVVRKETLLGMLILASAIVILINYVIATNITNGQYKTLHTYYYQNSYIFVFDVIYAIGIIFGSLCIYLAFAVTKSLYLKLCNYFDLKCKLLCESIAKYTFKNDTVEIDDPVQLKMLADSNQEKETV